MIARPWGSLSVFSNGETRSVQKGGGDGDMNSSLRDQRVVVQAVKHFSNTCYETGRERMGNTRKRYRRGKSSQPFCQRLLRAGSVYVVCKLYSGDLTGCLCLLYTHLVCGTLCPRVSMVVSVHPTCPWALWGWRHWGSRLTMSVQSSMKRMVMHPRGRGTLTVM